jgi:hypothetical protein
MSDILYYLQLAVAFLQGSSVPQTCWLIIGVGIRLAQDVGAHRRKVYGSKPSVVREQWIRVFWSACSFTWLTRGL